MNGRAASWKSEKIGLPDRLAVGSLEAVVDSQALAVAALEVASVVVGVALEAAEEGLVVATVEDVVVLLVVATTVPLHQERVILLPYLPTTSPIMPQAEETAALQSTFAM